MARTESCLRSDLTMMTLIDDETIQGQVDRLRQHFAKTADSGDYIARFEAAKTRTQNWAWASDEMFSVIPYHHELNRFKKGRVLKLQDLADAMQRGAYAFGFDEQRLILTMHPYEPGGKTGIECSVDIYASDQGTPTVHYETSVQYPTPQFKPRLVAVGTLGWINDRTRVDTRVGQDNAFSVAAYTYEDGRISYVDRFALGWNGQTRYDLIYDQDGELVEVKVGPVSWWKRKK